MVLLHHATVLDFFTLPSSKLLAIISQFKESLFQSHWREFTIRQQSWLQDIFDKIGPALGFPRIIKKNTRNLGPMQRSFGRPCCGLAVPISNTCLFSCRGHNCTHTCAQPISVADSARTVIRPRTQVSQTKVTSYSWLVPAACQQQSEVQSCANCYLSAKHFAI